MRGTVLGHWNFPVNDVYRMLQLLHLLKTAKIVHPQYNYRSFTFIDPDLSCVFCCRLSCQNIESYKRAVAFVMAYSFTEPPAESNENDSDSEDSDTESDAKVTNSPPMMVPMADILNHVAKNNARLDFDVDSLKMVATKAIALVSFFCHECWF
jgi:hypothetical protein